MTSYMPQHPSPLHLSTLTSPPLSPLAPSPPVSALSTRIRISSLYLTSPLPQLPQTPPPEVPALWTWSCHHCHRHYPLAATRRCLNDGHYFCSGATLDKRLGRVKKHAACGSVFDYVGWRDYGEWRRDVRSRKRKRGPKTLSENVLGCEGECDFPSECRWRPRLEKENQTSVSPIPEEVSPTSPSFPKTTKSPLSPTENGANVNKVVQSAEQHKSSTEKQMTRIQEGIATAFGFPVIDFTSFKAGMDKIHGVFTRDLISPSETNYEFDTEMSDIDVDDDTYEVGPRSGPLNFDYNPDFDAEGEVVVDVLPDAPSPRRNAWDWSIGGLGSELASMDGSMDLDR
ncbi:hypothetical protein MMC13_002780 [Lambiella insularis]|nr:hypothetical protein [Lambiella insularis]